MKNEWTWELSEKFDERDVPNISSSHTVTCISCKDSRRGSCEIHICTFEFYSFIHFRMQNNGVFQVNIF